MTVLLVAAGAAVGAPLRYVAAHLLDGRLHWGTILVNVVGSFLLGLFSGMALSGDATIINKARADIEAGLRALPGDS